MMVEILLTISVVVNTLFLFYIRWLFTEITKNNEDINIINTELQLFDEHLSTIYELEMFYGDETLKSLLDHGREISGMLRDFDTILDPDEGEERLEDEKTD